jgi:hypothetical protein
MQYTNELFIEVKWVNIIVLYLLNAALAVACCLGHKLIYKRQIKLARRMLTLSSKTHNLSFKVSLLTGHVDDV